MLNWFQDQPKLSRFDRLKAETSSLVGSNRDAWWNRNFSSRDKLQYAVCPSSVRHPFKSHSPLRALRSISRKTSCPSPPWRILLWRRMNWLKYLYRLYPCFDSIRARLDGLEYIGCHQQVAIEHSRPWIWSICLQMVSLQQMGKQLPIADVYGRALTCQSWSFRQRRDNGDYGVDCATIELAQVIILDLYLLQSIDSEDWGSNHCMRAYPYRGQIRG